MTDDDLATADDGETAMKRYTAWHTRNCRCVPANAAHDDAAPDNTHTDTDAAETRRDNQEKT
jgi:hypothetical protein